MTTELGSPCVIALDGETRVPVDGLRLFGGSGDKVANAAEQAARFLLSQAPNERDARTLLAATYIHFTSDGLPSDTFRFRPDADLLEPLTDY